MEPPLIPSPTDCRDQEHLDLLAIFHYVLAAILAIFACFPLIHVSIGLLMVLHPEGLTGNQHEPAPPAMIGYMFIIMGGIFIILGWGMAICTFISGRYLAKRRKRMFSFVAAALLCMFFPFGTTLGVFTIIVLSRPSAQRLFETT
jgi:uncharacterized membrane protein